MRTVLAFLALFIMFSFSVDVNKIYGNWKYKEIYQKQNYDAKTLEMTQKYLGDMQFEFTSSNDYHATGVFGKSEKGKWSLENKTIILKSEDGKTSKLEILDISDRALVISMGNAKIIMEKTAEIRK